MIEDYIRAIEEKLGTTAQGELELRDVFDIRLRIAELRLKLEHHDSLSHFLEEFKPILARQFNGVDPFTEAAPPENPTRMRAREVLRRMTDEAEGDEERMAILVQALEEAGDRAALGPFALHP